MCNLVSSPVIREEAGFPGGTMLPGGGGTGGRPSSKLQFARPMSVRREDRLNSASRRMQGPMGRGRLLAPLPQDRVKTPSTVGLGVLGDV